jgi:hypothetical protein
VALVDAALNLSRGAPAARPADQRAEAGLAKKG